MPLTDGACVAAGKAFDLHSACKHQGKCCMGMLYGEYGECCPATALRKHKGAKLFLDIDSAAKVL